MTALPGWYDDWLTRDLPEDSVDEDFEEPTPDPPEEERLEWDEE